MADTLHPCCFKSRMFIKSSRLSIGLLGQAQRIPHLGIFRPALLGNFQSALLGNSRPALTVGARVGGIDEPREGRVPAPAFREPKPMRSFEGVVAGVARARA